MCCFCVFVLFFFGAKLNEGVCIHYYDFHNLVERSLGKRRVGGAQRKPERQTPEDQTRFSGFQGPRKDRKPPFFPFPPWREDPGEVQHLQRRL